MPAPMARMTDLSCVDAAPGNRLAYLPEIAVKADRLSDPRPLPAPRSMPDNAFKLLSGLTIRFPADGRHRDLTGGKVPAPGKRVSFS
jgi:hypothetical protein